MRDEALEPGLAKTLDAVVAERSFAKAGERLGLTQQAVSAKIKRLEHLVGRALFIRDPGGHARLTADGEALLGYMRRSLAVADEAKRHFASIPLAGEVRLGMLEGFALESLPAVLAALQRERPRVKVSVQVGRVDQLIEGINVGRLDLIIGFQRPGTGHGEGLRRDRLNWVGDMSAWTKPGSTVGLVARPEPSMLRAIMIDALAQAGRPFEILFESDSLSCIQSAIINGIGISAIVTSFTSSPAIEPLGNDLPDLGELEYFLRVRATDDAIIGSFAQLVRGVVNSAGSPMRDDEQQPDRSIAVAG